MLSTEEGSGRRFFGGKECGLDRSAPDMCFKTPRRTHCGKPGVCAGKFLNDFLSTVIFLS